MRGATLSVLLAAAVAGTLPAGAAAQDAKPLALAAPRLTDQELARITGKFVLPNGVELALTVTSDTVVNGQLILRTVLTVDRGTQLQVFGRDQQTSAQPYVASSGTGAGGVGTQASGVTIALDRQSGIQTLTPTFAVAPTTSVVVGAASQSAQPAGLSQIPVTPGGPAIATADGTVSLQTLGNGSQVTLSGDRLAVVNLVGQSIGNAIVNSANNRTLDSVTTISIDARNLAPYQAGAAQMRVDSLVVNTMRGMVR